MAQRIVIVGGGLTAARAAEAAREAGFGGDIVVLAAEERLPYERPGLSKGYLLGEDAAESTIPLSARWYAEHGVEVRTGTSVTALDPAAHLAWIGDEELGYDRLLLATGASARPFPGPGAGLTGVHTLRTLHDSTVLRTALAKGGRRVVVVGLGWIGLEVASAARRYGNEVTAIGPGEVPLENVLGAEIGGVFARLHADNGVTLRTASSVIALRGDRHVDGVILGTGEELDADLVVVGIGATPNTALAEAAGLTVDNGVVTDAGLRTSAPHVFAAGDVANAFHPVLGRHLRVEHWANAQNQGAAAGRALAGEEVVYDRIPYFYTDQFDLGMEYSGYGPLAAEASVVVRGDLQAREFIAFWQRDGRVVAGMNVNIWDVNEQVQALIRSERAVDAALLADPSVDLGTLA